MPYGEKKHVLPFVARQLFCTSTAVNLIMHSKFVGEIIAIVFGKTLNRM